jgi:16S rRNA (guanine527-N7)-methyltransferase
MLNQHYRSILKTEAEKFNIRLSQEQIDSFSLYADMLVEWNKKINLTAITDEEGIVIKHFLDSLSVFPYIPGDTIKLIDVGTGAGFPGIPLKIANDGLNVTLLDSLKKRVLFLKEVIDTLKLENIKAYHDRAESFATDKAHRESYDAAVARAVAELPVLLEYCLPFVRPGGIMISMKGPDIEEEIKESEKALEILGGGIARADSFLLPNQNKRSVIIVKKYRHTPPIYPRKSGKPTKSPLK